MSDTANLGSSQTPIPAQADVVNAQKIMAGAGAWSGPVDGQYTEAFRQALRAWQGQRRLGVTGNLDTATQADFGKVIAFVTGYGPGDGSVDQKVTELYGPGLAVYLSVPEIGEILRQAATEGWDDARLQGRMQQTDWWRRQSATAREWDDLNTNDPGSANEKRTQRQAQVWDELQRLGGAPNPDIVQMVAEDSLRFGWNDAQLRDTLMAHLPKTKPGEEPGGSIGVSVVKLKDTARQYHINLDGGVAEGYARRIAAGELTEDAVTVTLRQQAKARYPFLSELIDNGITPEDYFSPYQQLLSQTLELPDQAIDFMGDDRFSKVADFVDDSGRRRAMTMTEAADYARSLPDYAKTGRADQAASSLSLFVGDTFGATA